MTIHEVSKILKKNRIDPFIYNIGKPKLAECLVIEKRDTIWVVYTWQKGNEWSVKKFDSEDAAARRFLDDVVEVASIDRGEKIILL